MKRGKCVMCGNVRFIWDDDYPGLGCLCVSCWELLKARSEGIEVTEGGYWESDEG